MTTDKPIGDMARFPDLVNSITPELARSIITTYKMNLNKSETERLVSFKLGIRHGWKWLNGNLVNICAYMIGDFDIIPPGSFKWLEEDFPNKKNFANLNLKEHLDKAISELTEIRNRL